MFKGAAIDATPHRSGPTDQAVTTDAPGESKTSHQASYGEALAWAVQNDPDVRTVGSFEAAAALSAVRLIAGLFRLPLELVSIDVWVSAAVYNTFQRVGAHQAAARFLASGCRDAGLLIEELYASKA